MDKLELHIFIIGKVWPEPGSSAAGARMMQLICALKENGWRVSFGSAADKSEYSFDLDSIGVEAVEVKLNNSSFDPVIRSLNPDAVMYDRFMTEEQYGWRVAEQCPDAVRILDTEDLHSLRYTRQKAVNQQLEFNTQILFNEEITKREIAAILRSDMSLIISGYEENLLKEVFEIRPSLLFYMPYLLESLTSKTVESWPGFEERSHFFTIGNYLHKPNADSVVYLKEKIWPLIHKRLPRARMFIYGAYADRQIFDLEDSHTGFYVRGRVENAQQVMHQARVCLAPLRFGAGLKGKLVDAMMCGLPSVTTSIGAEGIAEHKDWCGFIEDHPEEYADAAVKLYTDQTVWEKACRNGVRIINERFNKEHFTKRWVQRIHELKNNLEAHRMKNFTGRMLMHHTAASTRYMSKWIEAKNR